MCCYSTTKPLHVDHIKPVSKYPELKLEFDNLQILCENCNLGKSNIYYHHLRPVKIPNNMAGIKRLGLGNAGYLRITSKTCHIWDGKNTACKIWSSGSLKKNKAIFYDKPTLKVCEICDRLQSR
jgi:hypothetical protein